MEEEFLIQLCDFIRIKLLRTTLSNSAFAKKCDLKEGTIRNIVNGGHNLKAATINKIATGFKQKAWELLKESDDYHSLLQLQKQKLTNKILI